MDTLPGSTTCNALPAPEPCRTMRLCLRPPIPEITLAAQLLDDAVNAHLLGRTNDADFLIRQADMPMIREWGAPIAGKASPYIRYRPVAHGFHSSKPAPRAERRMPLQKKSVYCSSATTAIADFAKYPSYAVKFALFSIPFIRKPYHGAEQISRSMLHSKSCGCNTTTSCLMREEVPTT